MKPVLLDTGCIVALLDRSERYHAQCVSVLGELSAPLLTCEAVITEACYLLRNLRGAPQAVLQNTGKGNFLLPFRLSDNPSAVSALLEKYSDVPMDLADACLVAMAFEYRTGSILTLDSEFLIYRWGGNRTFNPLIPIG